MKWTKVKATPELFKDKEGLIYWARLLKEAGMVKSTTEGVRMINDGAVTLFFKEGFITVDQEILKKDRENESGVEDF